MSNENETEGRAVGGEDFCIEDWLVQPELNRIASRDRVTQVQPKIMQVLVCLAEQPGKVVTRERLFQVVWAGTNVTDHVLSRSVSELRKVFRDDARSPRVIETIPKTGYRLIASVTRPRAAKEESPDHEQAADSKAAGREATGPPRREWLSPGFLLRLIALAAVAGLVIIYVISSFSGDHHNHFHPH